MPFVDKANVAPINAVIVPTHRIDGTTLKSKPLMSEQKGLA